MELKQFRSIISDIGKNQTQFQDISKAVLETLAPGGKGHWRISKETQQNILNSFMEEDISNMIKNHLPQNFDFDRHSFSREVIRIMKEQGIELY